MMEQDVLPDVGFVLFLRLKVPARGAFDHTVFEMNLQIPEVQSLQVNLRYVKRPVRSLQHGRGEDLSDRNVDVRDTVFKIRLPVRVLQRVELHREIGTVSVCPNDMCASPQYVLFRLYPGRQ